MTLVRLWLHIEISRLMSRQATFSLNVEDQNIKVILHKSVTRSKLLTKIANMPIKRIAIDVCSGTNSWEREI